MMPEQSKTFRSREVQGMVLFTLAIFPLILVVMTLIKGQTPSGKGTAAIAAAIIDFAGYFPPILCAGGLAGLGVVLMLSTKEVALPRHIAGFVATSLGLAVCMGALNDVHGGVLGATTGGALRGPFGAWAGLVVGGAICLAAVWLAWMGGSIDFSGNSGQEATLSDALSEKDNEGVSEAEASALVPDETTLAYTEEVWTRSTPQPDPIPPSPYPEDVRQRGEVPEGAVPLATNDDATESTRETEAGAAHWRPAGPRPAADSHDADLGAGQDLVGEAETLAHELEAAETGSGLTGGPFEPDEFDQLEADILAETTPEFSEQVAPLPEPRDPRIPEGARALDQGGGVMGGPGVALPAWEQGALFDSSAGTGAAVGSPVAPSWSEATADEPAPAPGEEPELDGSDELEEAAELEEDELEEEEEEEGAELDEDEEDEEEEEEYEEEDELEEAAELDEDEEELEEAAELDEDEEEEEEEEEAAELEDEEEDEEEAAEPELEDEDEDEAAELEDEDEDEEAAALDDDEAAELEDEEAAGSEQDEPETEAPEPESEVVLQPQSPPRSVSTESKRPEDLVRDAGILFLDQGRVAVSLLQRRFDLDFDEACEVLDQLQEMGLIGPFMGGQQRDILLTLEEWQGRVTSS